MNEVAKAQQLADQKIQAQAERHDANTQAFMLMVSRIENRLATGSTGSASANVSPRGAEAASGFLRPPQVPPIALRERTGSGSEDQSRETTPDVAIKNDK